MIWVWSYHSNPSPPPIFAEHYPVTQRMEWARTAGVAPCFEVGPGESRKLQGQVGGGWTWGKSVQVVSSHGVPTFFSPWSVLGSVLAEFESSGHRFSHGFATESAIGPNSLPSGPPVTWLLIGFPTSLRVGKGTSNWIIQLCT